MSLLNNLRKFLYGVPGMTSIDTGDLLATGQGTQGLFGIGGESGGGLLQQNFNQMNQGQGFLSNIPESAILGAALYGQGMKGKDPLAGAFPAFVQSAQAKKLLTPKDRRTPAEKNADALNLKGEERADYIRAATIKTDKGLELTKIKNVDEGNKLLASYGVLENTINNMIERIPNTPTGFVGGTFGVVESLSDQLSQAAESLGAKSTLEIKDESVIDNYLQSKGITEGAKNYATMRSSVVNLAYNLAKLAEPNNPKFSEGDIIRQLDRINFGGSRDVFAASLQRILQDEKIRLDGTLEGLGVTESPKINKKKKKKDEIDILDPFGIL
jgi:hypothetical protein